MKQKHHKLAEVKARAYTTSLDDIIIASDNDDDDIKLDSDSDLDVMDRVELKMKDGLSIGDLVPELEKVSKDKLINDLEVYLVSLLLIMML